MVPHLPLVVIYTPKEVHSRIFVIGGVSRDKSLTPYMLAKKKFVLAKPDSPLSSILGTRSSKCFLGLRYLGTHSWDRLCRTSPSESTRSGIDLEAAHAMPAKKKPPVRSQYFNAIKEQKLDTLRWCLRHGGVNIKAEDDNGHTAVQIAAAGGLDQALGVLIEHVRKFGLPEDIEEPDEDGRTPLMMAAYNGKLACVQLLVLEGKAKLDAESDEGKTARESHCTHFTHS